MHAVEMYLYTNYLQGANLFRNGSRLWSNQVHEEASLVQYHAVCDINVEYNKQDNLLFSCELVHYLPTCITSLLNTA
eukprot:COSAG05_NODE_7346_length_824_cov_1.194483_2_plen_77_part_00